MISFTTVVLLLVALHTTLAGGGQPYLDVAIGGRRGRAKAPQSVSNRPMESLTAEERVTATIEQAFSGMFINLNEPITDIAIGRQIEKAIGLSMGALIGYQKYKEGSAERRLPNWVNGVDAGRILSSRQLDEIEQNFGQNPRDFFLNFDANSDGKVSLSEFHESVSLGNPKQTRSESEQEFAWADKNHDGFLTSDEFDRGDSSQGLQSSKKRVTRSRTAKVPIFQYLVELYLASRSHHVRHLLLTFADEVIDPNPPQHIQSNLKELGLVPNLLSLLLAVPVDSALLSHISRAGYQTTPFVLAKKAWGPPGPRMQMLEEAMHESGIIVPVGMSHLHQIRGSGDVEVGLAKILFMTTDVMRARNTSLLDSLELIAQTDMNSDQGHITFVLFPNLAGGQTFSRLKDRWNSGATNDFVMRDMIQFINEDLMLPLLKQLASGGEDRTVSVEFDMSDLSTRQVNYFSDKWRHGQLIPPRHHSVPAPALDFRELSVQSFNAGRNPLHEMAISGYGRLLDFLFDHVLQLIEAENVGPLPPLDAEEFRRNLEAQDSLDAAQQYIFDQSDARFNLRTSLIAALSTGDWRLNRTPFHFAGHWHGERSRTWAALCNVVRKLGLPLSDFIDTPDNLGLTARQYAGNSLYRDPEYDFVAAAPAFGDTVRAADRVTRTSTKSKLIKPRSSPAPTLSQEEIDTRWMAKGESGGWDVGKPRPDLELEDPERCDIREVFGAPTPDEMAVVVNSHRPVIWRGGAKALGLNRPLWSYDNLLEKYGDIRVKIADIPYRASFSSVFDVNPEKEVSLREYVETFKDPEDIPLYLFSSDFADDHPTIYNECRELIEFMDKVPGIQGLDQGQFFLGPAGTGAPVHWHSAAVNALFYGKKRWVVTEPKDALYSVKPALNFFSEDLDILRMENATTDAHFHRDRENKYIIDEKPGEWKIYEFTQHAGDLVLVPDFWGHGTLNVEPSIGIAFEMQNQNDKLFAFPSNVFRQVQISVPGTYHDL